MKIPGGFVWLPVLLVILGVLAVSGTAYWYVQHTAPIVPQEQTSQIATTTDETAGWKTYTDDIYGFSFKYPSTWFAREGDDGESVFFSKSKSPSHALNFATFYVISLTGGKEGGPLVYLTPQEYFDFYYNNNIQSSITGQPPLQAEQLGLAPVVKRIVVGDERYVMYTADREMGFVLYPGDSINHTEYQPGDDKIIEQIISTLTFKDSSKIFVKIKFPSI